MKNTDPIIFSRIDFGDLLDKIQQLCSDEEKPRAVLDQVKEVVQRAYSEKPFFFWGVSSNSFLSGLLYILTDWTQDSISKVFGCSSVTVRIYYKKWLSRFNWLSFTSWRKCPSFEPINFGEERL